MANSLLKSAMLVSDSFHVIRDGVLHVQRCLTRAPDHLSRVYVMGVDINLDFFLDQGYVCHPGQLF